MSDLAGNIVFKNTVDPTFACLVEDEKRPVYTVPINPDTVSFNVAQVNSASNSAIAYSFPMNPNFILAPLLVEEVSFQAVLNITNNTGGNWSLAGNVAPRAFPIDSASSSITMKINGNPLGGALNNSECVTPLFSFQNDAQLENTDLNSYASMLDNFSGAYVQGPATLSIKNVFADYYSSSNGFTGRTATVDWQVLDGTNIAAGATANKIVQFTVRTALLTGFNSLVTGNNTGIVGLVNQVFVTRNFLGNLGARILSIIGTGITLNAITATVGTGTMLNGTVVPAPNLWYMTYTMPESLVKIPTKTFYKYLSYEPLNNQTTKAIAAGSPVQLSSTTTLSSNPRCIYIWCTPKIASAKLITDSDAPGFYFQNLSISLGNNQNQFGNASQYQLYDLMCDKAGFRFSYKEATGVQLPVANGAIGNALTFGQVLRVDGSLFNLADDEAVGSACQKNLVINATVRAIDPAYASNVILNYFVVSESIVEIDGVAGTCKDYHGILSASDIKAIRAQPPSATYNNAEFGGNIIVDFLKKGYHEHIKPKLKDLARKGISYAQNKLGLGMHKRHRRRHSYRGGALNEDDDSYDSEDNDVFEEVMTLAQPPKSILKQPSSKSSLSNKIKYR